MADETFDNVPIRVVRSESQGAYLIQIGLDGAFRTFAAMKLGKLDSLREQARADQAAAQQAQADQAARDQREAAAQQSAGQEQPQAVVPPPPAQ